MKKYDVVHPIWSTELGLNSQGIPRHVVAGELTKKFAVFFSAAGVNASWFGLLYPDADGKLHGSSGDTHNVFDCRYNRYCPRLDAIAYYNAINAIAIKKFTAEKRYPDGVRAFLFRDRDSHALQVLWKDRGRQDVFIPLSGVKAVQVIRNDGSRHTFDAADHGLTLSVTEDPLLLLYDGPGTLPDALGEPAAALISPPATVARHGATTLTVKTKPGVMVELVAPPGWVMKKTTDAAGVQFSVTPSSGSAIREAEFVVPLGDGKGDRHGDLYFRAPIVE
jgi:hypothetical protein